MSDKFILDANGEPVPCDDIRTWGEWFQNAANRIIAHDVIGGAVRVSTVFLGIDHNFFGGGAPVLWETMIFGGGARSLPGALRVARGRARRSREGARARDPRVASVTIRAVTMLLFSVGCMPAPPKAKSYTCALYASCGPVMRVSTIEIDVRDNDELDDELVTWGQSCSAIALLETEDGECPWVLCDALCEPTWRAEAGADAS